MKWGSKYGPEYVNRLASMVRRHLQRPHRFVCMTEDGTGIDEGIEVKPLPEVGNIDGPERGWRKIGTFQNPLYDLEGPTLFLDLDVVIVDDIGPFFDHPGKFLIIKDWVFKEGPTGNSSVYRFEAGAHPDLLEKFQKEIAQIRKEVRNEQEYISRELDKQGVLDYWPAEWCASFKHSCMAGFPMNWFVKPRLPEGARIVVFHGHPNPDEAVAGVTKKFTRHVHPTPWVAEHWR